MFGSDLYIALVLGVTLSLIFTEKRAYCQQVLSYRGI